MAPTFVTKAVAWVKKKRKSYKKVKTNVKVDSRSYPHESDTEDVQPESNFVREVMLYDLPELECPCISFERDMRLLLVCFVCQH